LIRMTRAKYATARVNLVMEGNSGNLTATSAVVTGNKEADFAGATGADFPSASPTVATADGIQIGSSFGALDATKAIVELGVRVKNTSGTRKEMAYVTLTVDFSE